MIAHPAQPVDIRARVIAILSAESRAIASVQVTDQFEQAIRLIESCHGKVVTTGMGKAGHVADKFAATLCATGTPALYLHPGESAHGDLGVLASGDCLVALSTSGKTREVIEVLQRCRQLGVTSIISLTSHQDSAIRPLSDVVLDMGLITEPCPHGFTPSASTAVMSAICDAVALVLMEVKGITKQDFGLRHHGGYLGEQALR